VWCQMLVLLLCHLLSRRCQVKNTKPLAPLDRLNTNLQPHVALRGRCVFSNFPSNSDYQRYHQHQETVSRPSLQNMPIFLYCFTHWIPLYCAKDPFSAGVSNPFASRVFRNRPSAFCDVISFGGVDWGLLYLSNALVVSGSQRYEVWE